MKSPALYSIGTWDSESQEYTTQYGLSVPSVNVPWLTLLEVLRQLRGMGYTCHRRRVWCCGAWNHSDNDTSVLVERTDGKPFDGKR